MAANLYEEVKPELRYIADTLEDEGFSYKVYNHGIQYNVEDGNGIIQTFYPTTGTVLLHQSNGRYNHNTRTIKDCDLQVFMGILRNPNKIQRMFERR